MLPHYKSFPTDNNPLFILFYHMHAILSSAKRWLRQLVSPAIAALVLPYVLMFDAHAAF